MSSADTFATGFPDRGPSVFAVTVGTLVLASVFVAARLYCRIVILKRLHVDDSFIIAAWLLGFGLSFSINFATRHGLGRYDKDINPEDYGDLRKSEYVFSVLYNPALMTTKTSILLFFMRLSKGIQPVIRKVSWVLLIIVNLAGVTLTLLNIFQCRPIHAAFSAHVSAKCIPLLTEFLCSSPISIITDLAILALPIPVLTRMHLPPRQKYILVFTFALWIFVTIVGVVRVYYLQKAITAVPTNVSSNPSAIIGTEKDFAWNASWSLMWSAVEVNIGMTCACIPTLKPLVVRLLPQMLVEQTGGQNGKCTKDVAAQGSCPPRSGDSGAFVASLPSISEPAVPDQAHMYSSSIVSPRELAPSSTVNSYAAVHFEEDAGPSRNGGAHPSDVIDFVTALDAGPSLASSAPEGCRRVPCNDATSFGTMGGRLESKVHFGFVNMRQPKTMLHVSAQESLKYCTVVTILFLLWGISYGFLYALNNAVAAIADLTVAQTLGLTSAYFGGGYLFGPLIVGEWILRHDEHSRIARKSRSPEEPIGGFKATFILGLCIYGIGTICFWPSAVLASFEGFMFSHFVVGCGLAVLETAANPFIALCGPTEYSEMRLLFSQGFQAIGAVLSSLLAQKVFFANVKFRENVDSRTLIDVQWTYLAITLFCVVLALFFYYMPLPEVYDQELEEAARKIPVDPRRRSIAGWKLNSWSLALAVLALWTYTAAQETVVIFFHGLLTVDLPDQSVSPTDLEGISTPGIGVFHEQVYEGGVELSLEVSDYLLIVHSGFAISRFFVGYLAYLTPTNSKVPEPRTILAITTTLSLISGAFMVFLRPSNPNLVVIPTASFFLAEGPIWPLVFSLGLRGQGKRTKRAAAFLTMGGSGPAFFPFVVYGIVKNGGSIHTALVVVVVLLVFTCLYPSWLWAVPKAKHLVDPPTRHGNEVELDAACGGSYDGSSSRSDTRISFQRDSETGLELMEAIHQRKHQSSASALIKAFSWTRHRKRRLISKTGG